MANGQMGRPGEREKERNRETEYIQSKRANIPYSPTLLFIFFLFCLVFFHFFVYLAFLTFQGLLRFFQDHLPLP